MNSSARRFELICLGRAAVDLYAEQIGCALEDAQSFAKYIGGSAANIAVGSARLGLRVAMLSRVGDEQMGRFVRQALLGEGVDVSHVSSDPHRLTGLVLLGLRDRDTFPLLFYRRDCADMALSADEVDPEFIAQAAGLLVTGTHFSTPGVDAASRKAIAAARAAGTKVILDIDYRPVLWNLTDLGNGEQRFVASDRVSEHMLSIVGDCDIVVGTEEEIHIAGGSTDTLAALRALRARTQAMLVVKRGAMGCVVFTTAIPERLEDGLVARGPKVEVLNVLGAGDAFMAGLLRGVLRDESLEQACAYANACGALVVSRHGCAPAMPTALELDDYLVRRDQVPRPDLDARLRHLHRVTVRAPAPKELCILAFDHRTQLEELAAQVGASRDRLPRLKELLAQAALATLEATHSVGGVIIDDQFGAASLAGVTGRAAFIGRPIEVPGSRPVEFVGGDEVGGTLRRWPRSHVVKCLVHYHPDDETPLREEQLRRLVQLHDACVNLDRQLLLEVIPPAQADNDDTTLAQAIGQIYGRGVRPDWWKLPPPTSRSEWEHLTDAITGSDPHCHGVLLLGLAQPDEVLGQAFRHAADVELCKGFAVGRTIFTAPARAWLTSALDDKGLHQEISNAFAKIIGLWRAARPRRETPAGED